MTALLAAPTSDYQLLKLQVLGALGISKDAAHVYAGMALLLVSVALLRVPMRSFWALAAGVAATVVMEALDLRDGYADDRVYYWRASLKDVVNTNLLPLAVVLLARKGWLSRSRK